MSSYEWIISFWVCMVLFVVAISLSRLHSIIEMWIWGMFVGGGINIVSLVCTRVKCEFIMFV